MANEMRDRLKENISIIKQHNERGLPVKHITKGEKYEIEVIAEIVEDVSLIIEKMEKERLIEIPCNIGDTVYEVIAYKNKANGNRIDGHIRPCVVKSIHLSDRYSKKDEPYITLGAGGNYLHGAYIKRVSIDEFGKSIFPSEDQAEQKLKEMRGE